MKLFRRREKLPASHVWAWCPDCDVWTGVRRLEAYPAINHAAVYHARICPNAAARLEQEQHMHLGAPPPVRPRAEMEQLTYP